MNEFRDPFPRGGANTAFAQYFQGNSYLHLLSQQDVVIANVTFEPGCRNNWHIHHAVKGGGQILLCTAGRGWYQEWGKPARGLHAGDVVNIPTGVKHWHGASEDSWFAHIAVEVPGEKCSNEWLEPVDKEEYKRLSGAQKPDVPADRGALAEKKREELFGNAAAPLAENDPDFTAMRDRLIYGQIAWRGTLNDRMRAMITLATLTATQGLGCFTQEVKAALNVGVSPEQIKEAIYQCAPYAGIPRAEAALDLANKAFREKGVMLPVPSQKTTTEADRFEQGLRLQKSTFGSSIENMHESTPPNQAHLIKDYLSAYCFGDIYTRKTLDMKERELLTFCIIASLGGCEGQLKGHTQGNMNVGNTKENLIDALTQCMPYIGFPRTLNALAVVNEVIPESSSFSSLS